jgi:NADH-quinone oxidoreductase subunit M
MSFSTLPWLELTLLLPLLGAAVVSFLKVPAEALRTSLGFFVATLLTATAANLSFAEVKLASLRHFAVDDLAAPMLPVLAMLHLLTLLGTAKSRVTPMFCVRLLIAAFISLAAVTCQTPWMLIGLLVLGVLLPLWDLLSRGQPARGYLIHMSVFVVLLVVGWQFAGQKAGLGLLLLALLLRGGIVPLHGWLPTLFQGAAYGTAMVFVLPLMEVLVALRLLLSSTPEWMLNAASIACLITAVYGGGMAIVQNDVRKFYAHLCLSQTALVMFAVTLHTSNGLTAALCLWISSSLALAGLAFSVRALEARFGALSLREHHGFYEQVPGLAVCFLITGLASIGFPGTIGFVPMELLISGSGDQGLWISFTLAIAAMLNGIAILRAYFALFTGKRPTTSVSLRKTPLERAGIIVITLVIFLGGWFSPGVVASRHHTADKLLERTGKPAAPASSH